MATGGKAFLLVERTINCFEDLAMWEILLELLQTITGAFISFVVGLSLGTAVQQWRIRRLRKRLQSVQRERGQAEVALILSNREDITPSVQNFLDQSGKKDIPVFRAHQAESFSDAEADWLQYLGKIRTETQKLRGHGATRILLFSNVPVAMAVAAGALLDNGPEVVVHHYFNGFYRPVLRLAYETVKF